MKIKTLFISGAMAMSFAPITNAADVTINITGSSAFRAITHQSILNTLTGITMCWEGSGAALGSASRVSIKGTLGSDNVTVNCQWNGSVEGMTAVAAGSPTSGWINPAPGFPAPGTNEYLPLGAPGSPTEFGRRYSSGTSNRTSLTPNVANSDVYQASTNVVASLTDVLGGVIPFKFVVNKGASAAITNITDQQHEALWTAGLQPLSLFTGNVADTDLVCAVGRDSGSGTRVTRLAETRYGITVPVKQWRATTGSGAVSALRLWPSLAQEVNNPTLTLGNGAFNEGDGGYASGGTIATIFTNTSASVDLFDGDNGEIATDLPVHLISHLGLADAATAIGTPGTSAREISYNGSSYSVENVQEGRYTAWGYLHVLNSTGALSTGQIAVRDAIIAGFAGALTPFGLPQSGLPIAGMHVSRTSDGGAVAP
jgi:hypothetical protein